MSGGHVEGAQLGVVNVSGDVDGAQIGVVNIAAGRVRGLQLGIVNIGEEADAAIGLVGIHPRGRTQLRVGLDSNLLINASLVHGARVTHSILSVGAQPFVGRPLAALGFGLGARASFTDEVHLDFDGLRHVLLDEDVSITGPASLYEVRAVLGVRVVDAFGLYAGLAYRVHVSRHDEPTLGTPWGETYFTDQTPERDLVVRGWPALTLGIELF